MGKSGTALGIIGVIIGAGGVGFAFLNWMNLSNMQQVINQHEIWYEVDDLVYAPTESIYTPIPNMSLIVDLGAPVSLHLLFTCIAGTYPDAGSYSDFFFYFAIDGVRLDNPWTRTGQFQETTTTNRYSVTLQHFIVEMAPGIYNFSVQVYSERAGNYIRETAFSIKSYPI